MSAHLLERARRAPIWLRNRIAPPAVVLCYHRVASLDRDPFRLAIDPTLFEAHLREILRLGRPTSLSELTRAVRAGRRLARAVVVTFDDGYSDNLHTAKPILERLGVPATVFVSSGYTNGEREFWWDALERLILGPHALPPAITLPLNGAGPTWAVEPSAAAPEDDSPAADRGAARYRLLRAIHAVLLAQPSHRIDAAIAALQGAVGLPAAARPTHRACTAAELRLLAAGGSVEIGAHSRMHPRLAALTDAEQLDEIAGSKADIEAILRSTVASFAYPFGDRGAYTPVTARIVRDAGFDSACTLDGGVVTGRGSDLFRIPRVVVHHTMPADELARTLGWLAFG